MKLFRRAIELCESLAADFPSVPDYRYQLAIAFDNLSLFLFGDDCAAEAEQSWRRAVELEEKLVADSPSVPRYKKRLAISCGNLGELIWEEGRHQDAEPLLRRCVALFEELVADSPADRVCRRCLASDRVDLGRFLAETGRTLEAEHEFRRAIPLCEKLAAEDPSDVGPVAGLAACRQLLADILYQTGRPSEAEQEYRQVIALLAKEGDGLSLALAGVLATCLDHRIRDPQTAIALAKRAQDQRPDSPDHWNAIGVVNYRAGDWEAPPKRWRSQNSSVRAAAPPAGSTWPWPTGNKETGRRHVRHTVMECSGWRSITRGTRSWFAYAPKPQSCSVCPTTRSHPPRRRNTPSNARSRESPRSSLSRPCENPSGTVIRRREVAGPARDVLLA